MIKLIDKTNRNVLMEGRNYQMGFGFAKKLAEDSYEIVTPISPCKDYLNDVIWTEKTGKPSQVYGLKYDKQDVYDKEYAYLVISILDKKNGGLGYNDLKKDRERLQENYKKLEAFMNHFEETLTEGIFTKIEEIDDNRYLVSVPIFFTKGTYLISLYSLLLRAGQYWDGNQDPMEFLENFSAFLIDVTLVKQVAGKLKKLLEIGYIEQDFNAIRDTHMAHNYGIIGFKEL